MRMITVPRTSTGTPLPQGMANKNKKKGFLKNMEGVTGKKIVFEEENAEEIGSTQLRDAEVATSNEEPSISTLPSIPAEAALRRQSVQPNNEPQTSRRPDTVLLPPLPPSRMHNLASNCVVTQRWFQVESRQEAMKDIRRQLKRIQARQQDADSVSAPSETDLHGPPNNLSSLPKQGELSREQWAAAIAVFRDRPPLDRESLRSLGEGSVVGYEVSVARS
jgi:hypothetical protein